ncbi:hypothetical protein GJ744_010806 [Endocarpon pusillum]|uniref:Uncharacterized protein n=1 Tax=Endocarpon pusillum TaxID=364733 RepID=A0A8H7AE46_9EURO|nr:hypothetical protein GJ744_010806 [Endocarpon pusillum]
MPLNRSLIFSLAVLLTPVLATYGVPGCSADNPANALVHAERDGNMPAPPAFCSTYITPPFSTLTLTICYCYTGFHCHDLFVFEKCC